MTAPTARTTSAFKRAGTVAAHLPLLIRLHAFRKLMLLQVIMREQKQQVVLFNTTADPVTLTLLGGESVTTAELQHRAGSVNASDALEQLQLLAGSAVQDPAFSVSHLKSLIDAETLRIEQSPELAALDRVLAALDFSNDVPQGGVPATPVNADPVVPPAAPVQAAPEATASNAAEDTAADTSMATTDPVGDLSTPTAHTTGETSDTPLTLEDESPRTSGDAEEQGGDEEGQRGESNDDPFAAPPVVTSRRRNRS
ncbi:hypothetical protein [Deinococcus sonorensis]|uniref:Uncharacterized protein n=2 Tax=Deinococcus sonorensis TaxID=309891 RepID=A0AAU7U8E8_9DEIO